MILQSAAMSFSGLFLAFAKGWSLALPMLLLVPILCCGLMVFIKNITARFVISATAFSTVAAFADETLSSMRIITAFGMEKISIENYLSHLKIHAGITTSVATKSGFSFGLFIGSMYFGYSYAFFLGSIWVDQGFWNHAHDRPYSAGDIISIFFGVLFGVFALGGIGPNVTAL